MPMHPEISVLAVNFMVMNCWQVVSSGVLFITETRELSATHYSSYDLFGLMQNMYLQYYIKVKWYIGVRYMYEHYDIKVQYMYM